MVLVLVLATLIFGVGRFLTSGYRDSSQIVVLP